MTLENILKEIKTASTNATMDVSLGSPDTYFGRVGLKRAATEALKYLKVDYRNELMKTTVFLVVTGSEREEFTNLASSPNFECFSADPEEFYKDVASRINSSLYGREGVKHLFGISENILYDKAMELGLKEYTPVRFNEKYNVSVTTPQDFAAVMKTAINDQMGSEIVGINAVYSLVDKAIEKGHSSAVTPVLLSTSDERFALDLQKNLSRLAKVFLVVTGKPSKTFQKLKDAVYVKTVSEGSVGEALEAIRNKL